jgi:sarcosine oxidase delta subunit
MHWVVICPVCGADIQAHWELQAHYHPPRPAKERAQAQRAAFEAFEFVKAVQRAVQPPRHGHHRHRGHHRRR